MGGEGVVKKRKSQRISCVLWGKQKWHLYLVLGMHAHNFDAYNINWPLTWTRPWKTTKHSPFSENMPREPWSPTGAQSLVQCRIWFLTGRRPTGCIQHTKDGRLKYGYDIEKKQQVCQICKTTKLQQNFLWRLKCRPLSEKEFIRWTIMVSAREGAPVASV